MRPNFQFGKNTKKKVFLNFEVKLCSAPRNTLVRCRTFKNLVTYFEFGRNR